MTEPHPVGAHETTPLSSAEVIDHLLNRIGEIDAPSSEKHQGLNSVIEVNPDAMAIAMERDAERRDGRVRGPLHGVPVLIKDNIDSGDAMQTTAGSLALVGSSPNKDAPVVARLREAGLVVLGKTNLSEWANMRSPHSTSGWSARGGLTRNPWDLTRSAGGSSSGSAAAVAAQLAPLAVGTETDGSIVCPASFNGVVGIKPTVGLLPQDGIVPISHSQDSPGPFAASVLALSELLDALCGSDQYGEAHQVTHGLSGIRIGALRSCFGAHAATDAVADEALQHLSRAGATVVDVTYPDKMGSLDDDEMLVLLCEFKQGLNAYLGARPDPCPHSIADVIAFNRAHEDAELQWFGQEFLEQANASPGLDDSTYQQARSRGVQASRDNGIDALLATHELDALVAPAFPPAGVIDLVNGDADVGGQITSAPSVAGYPILSLPMGFVHGLPVGLAITGTAHSEPMLIQIAGALEASLGLLDAGALTPPL